MIYVVYLLYFTQIAFILFLIGFILILGYTTVFGGPYLPSSSRKIKLMLDLAKAKKGEKLIDMGSGDGAIIIAAGQRGLEALGFEINPFLIWKTRQNIRKAGLNGKVFVHWTDMW
mgnify:CR=1 FL=1